MQSLDENNIGVTDKSDSENLEFKLKMVDGGDTRPLSSAEKMYKRHLTNVKKYQHKNPEKMKEKAKRYMQKLKMDTVKYEVFLEKRRNYYLNVVKPKKQKLLEEAHEALPTTLVI